LPSTPRSSSPKNAMMISKFLYRHIIPTLRLCGKSGAVTTT
jgi:hypothetical protein